LVISQAFAEPSLESAQVGNHYQFQRIGYYTLDRDSSAEKLIFNRTVTLKDSFKLED
jgi:glutamine--tRNA ligase